MRTPTPPPIEQRPAAPERVWPLDLSIVALASLVLYVITTRLQFDDPRWLFNAWTYIVAVPLIALFLALLSHGIVTQRIQKSIQLGFLFSVFVHLLLLLLAINVIIFSKYLPSAFSGVKPDRRTTQKTVPEYLFRAPEEQKSQPDWSQPVDAVTTSRIKPDQPRMTTPLENSSARRELPVEKPPERPMPKDYLKRRELPEETLPTPAESASRLSRREIREAESSMSMQSPNAPTVPAQSNPQMTNVERRIEQQRRATRAGATTPSVINPTAPASARIPLPLTNQMSLEGARSTSTNLPRIGQMNESPRRQRATPTQAVQPAGSSPAAQSVAVAQLDAAAPRVLAPSSTTVERSGRSQGAPLTNQPNGMTGAAVSSVIADSGDFSPNQRRADSGMPVISGGSGLRAPGRGRQRTGIGLAPAGALTPGDTLPEGPMNVAGDAGDTSIGDRLGPSDVVQRSDSQSTGATRTGSMNANTGTASLSPAMAGPALDISAPEGPGGFSLRARAAPAAFPSRDGPQIAALDINRGSRPRKNVGGPITAAGSQVTSVDSFARRVMRTKSGASPAPGGLIGPATEEAIELGLKYLAKTQNQDGSWSLQGHGTDVILRSDTAATGLCLLAFQGAGYTHRQHRYQDTVNRGLLFLVRNQKSNGNLYRSENQVSDQNVALYSHGIASLALCEAFGMTQDPDLRDPAQACLDYIINTQHRQRGGWRYTPQVSADTSVTGWMMMSLKSGQLSGLEVPDQTYAGIDRWLQLAQSPSRPDRYRYNPFAPDTPTQRHGRSPTPTMTSVGMLMRMYSGWRRDTPAMRSAADYILKYPPEIGTASSPQRDTYYWYYATQVMFHMGGETWEEWNKSLNPLLLEGQITSGPLAGSWDPMRPVPDRWAVHAGRLYVTTMNLLNLEVFYRHLPIYDDTAE